MLKQYMACGLELKLSEQGNSESMTFEGYGAIFGNVDSYGDVIAPGAFAETLAQSKASGQWPALLLQHGGFTADDMTPIGVITDLAEDGTGLRMQAKLAPTTRGRDAYALLKMDPRPAITGLSIGYIAKEWSPRSKPEEPRRTLKKIDLFEISLVTFPANPKARIASVKSGLSKKDAERALRDAGFSRTEAMAIVAEGFNAASSPRDAGQGGAANELAKLLERIRA